MNNFTFTSKFPGNVLRHLERRRRIACGVPAEGALVVDDAEHATCQDCLAVSGLSRVFERRN